MSPSVQIRRLVLVSTVLPLLAVAAFSSVGEAHAAPVAAHKAKKPVFLERHVAAIKGGLPNIQARGAIVLDEDGHEIYARNPDQERPIASISKLAATLAVMDRGLDLDGLSTITKADIECARGGARSRLLEGMTLSNRDLLHAALMGSDNRAIPTLGRAVKLSPTQLAAAMTAKAADLGLKHTRFHDPTGLSVENVSTPRETVALLKAVMKNPILGPVTERVQYDAHPVGRPPITYVNTYRPAIRNNVQVLGGKTGYNDDARYCLVIATKVDGHVCYMSFLSNEGKLTRFGDVARVADWIVSRKPRAPAAAAAPMLAATAPAAAPTTPLHAIAARAKVNAGAGKHALPAAQAPSTATAAAREPDEIVTAPPSPAAPDAPAPSPPAEALPVPVPGPGPAVPEATTPPRLPP